MSVSFHAFNFSSVTSFFFFITPKMIFLSYLEQLRQWYLRYIFRIDLRNDLLYDQVHSIDSFHYSVSHKRGKDMLTNRSPIREVGHFSEHRDRESCVIVNSNVIERERGRGTLFLNHPDVTDSLWSFTVALICMQQSLLFSPFILLFTIPSCVNDSVITVCHRVIVKRKCFGDCLLKRG